MIGNHKKSVKRNHEFSDLESQDGFKKRKTEQLVSKNSEQNKDKNMEKRSLQKKSSNNSNKKEIIEHIIKNELSSVESNVPSGNVAVQTRIMLHLKERHLQGNIHPISIHEIMREMDEKLDRYMINYLEKEYFHHNPKIEAENGKYKFKPLYDIKSSADLLKLLKDQFENGEKTFYCLMLWNHAKRVKCLLKNWKKEIKLFELIAKRIKMIF